MCNCQSLRKLHMAQPLQLLAVGSVAIFLRNFIVKVVSTLRHVSLLAPPKEHQNPD
jgi:hypothetical protein